MAYTTAAVVRAYLKTSDTGDDTLIGNLIDRAQALIDSYTGRTFECASDGATTRYFHAVDDVHADELIFDGDICEITTVTNGDAVEVASDEYTVLPRNHTPYYGVRLLPSAGKAWTGKSNGDNDAAISVLGKWAYATTPPDDIVHACIRLTVWLYRQRADNNDLDRPTFTPDGQMVMPITLPNDVQAMLKRYRSVA